MRWKSQYHWRDVRFPFYTIKRYARSTMVSNAKSCVHLSQDTVRKWHWNKLFTEARSLHLEIGIHLLTSFYAAATIRQFSSTDSSMGKNAIFFFLKKRKENKKWLPSQANETFKNSNTLVWIQTEIHIHREIFWLCFAWKRY